MKKFLAVNLAVAMALSMTACGSKQEAAPVATEAAAEAAGAEAEAPAAEEDDYQLTIKFSNVFQPAEWNYKASEYLAEIVKEKTDGHIIL